MLHRSCGLSGPGLQFFTGYVFESDAYRLLRQEEAY